VHYLKLPVSNLRRSQSWYESRLGYRLTEEFREHGDLAGIGMEHPNGCPGLAFRLDPEPAGQPASTTSRSVSRTRTRSRLSPRA
jgi:catechol 2,3-dioxygenase-like lactoylglutathione lyase family enzyme